VAAVLFILGAVVVDAVRGDEDSTAETAPATTTSETETVTETGPAPLPDSSSGNRGGLPRSYVVTLHCTQLTVPPSSEFFEVLSLELRPGRYEVTGRLGLHNRDPQAPFTVDCTLVPSNPDGSRRPPGEAGSDAGFMNLHPSGGPGDQDDVALFVSQTLRAKGTVRLGCSGYGNTHGAFTNYVSIRALEVASIETREARSP
jgi:hypothetical protein